MALVLTPLNGLLPAHMLRVVDGGRGPRGPQRLRLDAADAYDRCLRAGMPPGCLRSGYRTRAEQQAEVDRAKAGKTPLAAAPGKSYHGEGTAADVDEPARSWLHRHGAAYGWRAGLIASEPWHFVYDPDYDQHRDTHDAPVPDLIRPTPTPTPPADPFGEDDTMHERAIIAAYRKHCGRTPGATEVDDRILRIATGQRTLAQEINDVAGSAEARRYPVVRLYRTLLGRSPSTSEADDWLTKTGGDLAQIEAGIKRSAEYKSKH